jgi:L-threonylcarbamoyladenylate synthase
MLHERGFEILRPGAVTEEDLQGTVPHSGEKSPKSKLRSPGLLKSHYSPRKPLYVEGDPRLRSLDPARAGLISFGEPEKDRGYRKAEILSKEKDLREAAVNLFSALHRLDDSDIDFIVAEPVPRRGIGIAIMNRLEKASYPGRESQDKR